MCVSDDIKTNEAKAQNSGSDADIWVTMGLCWSNNTHYWGKDKFPYKEAAPMSSRLWMKLTGARVVLTVVYSEEEPDAELLAYKQDLEEAGALVKLVPRATGVKCVLEAQLIRMLAYLYPEVKKQFKTIFNKQLPLLDPYTLRLGV